jgi:phage tail tape-measure protein
MSGAKLGTELIPVPFVGTVVGAVVGGAVGSEVGRRLGKALLKGGGTFVTSLRYPED